MQNNESILDKYQRIYQIKEKCIDNKTSYFLEHHESTTDIIITRTGETIKGVLVLNDQDGADSAYLYVHINADFQVCDYFTWNTTTFFAYEQVGIVKNVDFIKFKVLQCNVLVNDSIWGYFIGPMKNIKDIGFSKNAEFSRMVPTLICPRNDFIKTGTQITFNEQVWNVEDADIYTLTNIGYFSLSRGINAPDIEEIEEAELDFEHFNYVGEIITLPTENGYFVANKNVKLLKRSLDSITIQFMEEGEVSITTLNNTLPKQNNYNVKENV